MPTVAPKGHNLGSFGEIAQESGKDKLGKDYSILKVPVILAAKDPEGKAYQVEQTYNLLGRGVREFKEDFLSWTGRMLTDEELDAFNAEAEMKGKPVIVDLSHRKEGKKIVADIEKFLPVPATQTPTIN